MDKFKLTNIGFKFDWKRIAVIGALLLTNKKYDKEGSKVVKIYYDLDLIFFGFFVRIAFNIKY